jgi:hypothetical protein
MRLPCGFLLSPQREPGGRGRIRTFVARKERQIYSLLVLATHPPVPQNYSGCKIHIPRKLFGTRTSCPELVLQQLTGASSKNTKRTRVKRHQPVQFCLQDSLRLTPLLFFWWSWRRELNPRPSDYKSDALPAELRQRRSNQVRIAEGVQELQGDVPQFEHAKDQVCGNPGYPVSSWVPAILFCVYSLAWTSNRSKTLYEKPQFLRPGGLLSPPDFNVRKWLPVGQSHVQEFRDIVAMKQTK